MTCFAFQAANESTSFDAGDNMKFSCRELRFSARKRRAGREESKPHAGRRRRNTPRCAKRNRSNAFRSFRSKSTSGARRVELQLFRAAHARNRGIPRDVANMKHEDQRFGALTPRSEQIAAQPFKRRERRDRREVPISASSALSAFLSFFLATNHLSVVNLPVTFFVRDVCDCGRAEFSAVLFSNF